MMWLMVRKIWLWIGLRKCPILLSKTEEKWGLPLIFCQSKTFFSEEKFQNPFCPTHYRSVFENTPNSKSKIWIIIPLLTIVQWYSWKSCLCSITSQKMSSDQNSELKLTLLVNDPFSKHLFSCIYAQCTNISKVTVHGFLKMQLCLWLRKNIVLKVQSLIKNIILKAFILPNMIFRVHNN